MSTPTQPLIRTDGTVNIIRKNLPRRPLNDLYHHLLLMRWRNFVGLIVLVYLLLNSLFAALYTFADTPIANAENHSYLDAFFFSVQTMSTVGYGHMYPQTVYGNVLVTLQTAIGLIGLGMLGGLSFAKFSRPSARIVFSNNVLITQYNGKRVLMFRVANARSNQILDARMSVTLFRSEITEEGQNMRRLVELKLLREYTPIFALSWTVMHVLDESSPLRHLDTSNAEDEHHEFEALVNLIGTDGTFFQPIHAMHYFHREDLLHNHLFEDILTRQEDGSGVLDFGKFHSVRPCRPDELSQT